MSKKTKMYYPDDGSTAVDMFKKIITKENTDAAAAAIACTETKVDATGKVIPCKKGGN